VLDLQKIEMKNGENKIRHSKIDLKQQVFTIGTTKDGTTKDGTEKI
jgi:hypothetical protein